MAIPEFCVFGITFIVIHTVSHFKKRIHQGIICFILLTYLSFHVKYCQLNQSDSTGEGVKNHTGP